MGHQIVWALFADGFLFLLREHADRVAYNFRLCLTPLSRQPPNQRFRIGVQTNTQRHVTTSSSVIHKCTTGTGSAQCRCTSGCCTCIHSVGSAEAKINGLHSLDNDFCIPWLLW